MFHLRTRRFVCVCAWCVCVYVVMGLLCLRVGFYVAVDVHSNFVLVCCGASHYMQPCGAGGYRCLSVCGGALECFYLACVIMYAWHVLCVLHVFFSVFFCTSSSKRYF